MAWELNLGADLAMRASANVSALSYTGNPPVYSSGGIAQYTAVTQDTSTKLPMDVIAATSTSLPIYGILQNRSIPQSGPGAIGPGESAQVRWLGVTKLMAGSALDPGTLLMNDGSGRGILATTGLRTFGLNLSAATAAGDEVSLLLVPLNTLAP